MNRPEIQNVSIVPNPVNAKGSLKVTVQAIDKVITFEKVVEYAKEIYSGQQIGAL